MAHEFETSSSDDDGDDVPSASARAANRQKDMPGLDDDWELPDIDVDVPEPASLAKPVEEQPKQNPTERGSDGFGPAKSGVVTSAYDSDVGEDDNTPPPTPPARPSKKASKAAPKPSSKSTAVTKATAGLRKLPSDPKSSGRAMKKTAAEARLTNASRLLTSAFRTKSSAEMPDASRNTARRATNPVNLSKKPSVMSKNPSATSNNPSETSKNPADTSKNPSEMSKNHINTSKKSADMSKSLSMESSFPEATRANLPRNKPIAVGSSVTRSSAFPKVHSSQAVKYVRGGHAVRPYRGGLRRPEAQPRPAPKTTPLDRINSERANAARLAEENIDVQLARARRHVTALLGLKERDEWRRAFETSASLSQQRPQPAPTVWHVQMTQLAVREENCFYQQCLGLSDMVLVRGHSRLQDSTTHLVVGTRDVRRTEKLLAAIAKGTVYIVNVDYLHQSFSKGKLLPAHGHDLGIAHSASSNQTLFIADRQTRKREHESGGVFRDWRVAVVIAEVEVRKSYELILTYGGAKIYYWTLDALLNADMASFAKLTHILIDPSGDSVKLQQLLSKTLIHKHLRVVSYVYVEEFLTSSSPPDPDKFSYSATDRLHFRIRTERARYQPSQRVTMGSPHLSLDPSMVTAYLSLKPRCAAVSDLEHDLTLSPMDVDISPPYHPRSPEGSRSATCSLSDTASSSAGLKSYYSRHSIPGSNTSTSTWTAVATASAYPSDPLAVRKASSVLTQRSNPERHISWANSNGSNESLAPHDAMSLPKRRAAATSKDPLVDRFNELIKSQRANRVSHEVRSSFDNDARRRSAARVEFAPGGYDPDLVTILDGLEGRLPWQQDVMKQRLREESGGGGGGEWLGRRRGELSGAPVAIVGSSRNVDNVDSAYDAFFSSASSRRSNPYSRMFNPPNPGPSPPSTVENGHVELIDLTVCDSPEPPGKRRKQRGVAYECIQLDN